MAIGTLCLGVSCSSSQSSEQSQPSLSDDPCADLRGLTEAEIAAREGLNYVAKSPHEEMLCTNCKSWLPPKGEKPCGGCVVFKGPVHPGGYCTYWGPLEG